MPTKLFKSIKILFNESFIQNELITKGYALVIVLVATYSMYWTIATCIMLLLSFLLCFLVVYFFGNKFFKQFIALIFLFITFVQCIILKLIYISDAISASLSEYSYVTLIISGFSVICMLLALNKNDEKILDTKKMIFNNIGIVSVLLICGFVNSILMRNIIFGIPIPYIPRVNDNAYIVFSLLVYAFICIIINLISFKQKSDAPIDADYLDISETELNNNTLQQEEENID